MRRQTRPDVRLELAREPGRPATPSRMTHERLDHLAAHRIGHADRRRERDRLMALQAVLDLARADTVAAARDEIVLAADEPEVALRVLPGQVAGERPVADELLPRGGLVVPVAQEHHGIGPAHGDLPDLVRGRRLPLVVHHVHDVARDRPPHRPGLHRHRSEQLPSTRFTSVCPPFVRRDAERLARPADHLLAHRLAPGEHQAQREVPAAARIADRSHHLEHGRHEERVPDAVSGEDVEGALGVELLRPVGDHRHAVMPGSGAARRGARRPAQSAGLQWRSPGCGKYS